MSGDVKPGIARERPVPSANPLCTSNMGRESEEPGLPSLQHLILYGKRKDGQTLSHSYNGLFTNRSPQVTRCTASMDIHQSPRRRTTSSSLFNLSNDDSGATNTAAPSPAQRGATGISKSCPPDPTPQASNVFVSGPAHISCHVTLSCGHHLNPSGIWEDVRHRSLLTFHFRLLFEGYRIRSARPNHRFPDTQKRSRR